MAGWESLLSVCDQVTVLQVQGGRFGDGGSERLKLLGEVECVSNDWV